ncbi:MAG: hypothetical protein U0Q16_29665 [Bryobacteraceae bacterium]
MRHTTFALASAIGLAVTLPLSAGHTEVAIHGEQFLINGKPTYQGRTWNGNKIEGLLMNSRMIQGVFDDENPETVNRWKYPDTGRWDAERNMREYRAAMPEWRKHGLLAFTLGMQGGSPEGYSKVQPWRNSAYGTDGALKKPFAARLKRILDKADALGMVVILNYFYFGQDEWFADAAASKRAVTETTQWVLRHGYRNVIVDLVNECDNRSYDRPELQAANLHELIEHAKSIQVKGRRLLVGTSFNGGRIPLPKIVEVSDFVLLHGNGVKDPNRIAEMVKTVRAMPVWKPKPVLFNEDDHFDFDRPVNNMRKAIESYAGWGYFDPGKGDYSDGYQSMPVKWSINSERKKAFFAFLKEVTGQ